MTRTFIVAFRDHTGERQQLLTYAINEKEARVAAIESHPYIHQFPNSIDYIVPVA